ncbi:MAG: hypothetical protein ACRC9L_03170 [Brevinema sp.]
MVVFLMSLSKKKYHFDILKLNEVPNVKQWILALIIVIIAITVTTIVWGGLKPIKEYRSITESVFQNVYYLFETALILLTIIFGQKFGEMIVKKYTFPFGGLFLALTWGLIHILLQGPMTGLYAFAMSLLYGTVYVLLQKNFKYSYILIAIIFIV